MLFFNKRNFCLIYLTFSLLLTHNRADAIVGTASLVTVIKASFGLVGGCLVGGLNAAAHEESCIDIIKQATLTGVAGAVTATASDIAGIAPVTNVIVRGAIEAGITVGGVAGAVLSNISCGKKPSQSPTVTPLKHDSDGEMVPLTKVQPAMSDSIGAGSQPDDITIT